MIWLWFDGELNTANAELQSHISVLDPNSMYVLISKSNFMTERKTFAFALFFSFYMEIWQTSNCCQAVYQL